MTKQKNITKYAYMAAVVLYGCACFFLYYKQLTCYGTGLYEADTPVHVSMAVEDHFAYSLTAFLYLFFNLFPIRDILIALLLAGVTAGAVPLTDKLIRQVLSLRKVEIKAGPAYLFSFAANFVMGFYVSTANVQHYIGYQNANMWHNSTYLVMRFFALLVLIKYLKIYETKTLSVRDWILFSVLLLLTTAVKPSFLVVFAPVMALELVSDLVRKVPFLKAFCFGCTVIPSLLVILLQSSVLFGEDTGNGYAISPFTALSQRGDHPKVTLILSVLFPLLVFFFHIRDFYKDRIYMGSLLVGLVGFLEVFLFTETGTRSGDSNFMWGYSIALFILFLESMVKLWEDFRKEKRNISEKSLQGASALVLCWHVISGIWYFVLLLTGATYFI